MYRPKYRKVVDAVFEGGGGGGGEPAAGSVGKLVYYAQMSPHKLPKIARELEKRVHEGLRKQQQQQQHQKSHGGSKGGGGGEGSVGVAMRTFQELVKGCRENVPLFEDVLARLMEGLAEDPAPAAKALAAETFVVHADALVAATAAASRLDYDRFVAAFVSFARAGNAAVGIGIASQQQQQMTAEQQRTLRMKGLRALRACIRALELRDDLDSFVLRAGASFVAALLDNLRSSASSSSASSVSSSASAAPPSLPAPIIPMAAAASSAAATNELATLAGQCLQDLAERLKNLTVGSLMRAVLQYLDERGVWAEAPDFATQCLLSVAHAVKSKDKPVVAAALVRHLDAFAQQPTPVKRSAIVCISAVLGEAQVLPIADLLSPAVRHMAASVRACAAAAAVQNAAAVSAERGLQADIIRALGTIARKQTQSAPKLEAVEFVVARLEEELGGASPASAPVASAVSEDLSLQFGQLALEIAGAISEPLRRPGSESLVCALLRMSEHKSADVRLVALRVLHVVLSGGMLQSIMDAVSEKSATGADFSAAPAATDPIVTHADQIRRAMAASLAHRTTRPEHVWAVWVVLVVVLARLRNKELPRAIPFVFELQERAHAKPSMHSRAVVTLVAGYLRVVARIYGRGALRDLVAQFLERAKAEKAGCAELGFEHGLLVVRKKKFQRRTKDAAKTPVDVLFDREQVVDILCHIQSLAQEHRNLKQMLLSRWDDPSSATSATSTAAQQQQQQQQQSEKKLAAPRIRVQRSPSVTRVGGDSGADGITFKSVADTLRLPRQQSGGDGATTPAPPSPAAAASSSTTAEPRNLSFARVVASCREYNAQMRTGFESAMAAMPKPSEARTDLLGSGEIADTTLLDPEACPDVDWDRFVAVRLSHFPRLFEVFPEPSVSF